MKGIMKNSLINKNIVLGVTGSIAAYKAAEVIRELREQGANIRVVMTSGAKEFITELTLQTLSGHPVSVNFLDTDAEATMGHIELARWADAILIAPASANFLSQLAQGRASHLLCAICLATEAPLIVAPAMNTKMWLAAATKDNIKLLQQRGILCCGPADGEQACGDVGVGRLLAPEVIVRQLSEIFDTGSLAGKLVLITAGPTREAIDPVRFLSNHSSGKMGYAVALAAMEAGARVKLISGPVALENPDRVERFDVTSAEEMLNKVQQEIVGCDIFISTAAVADYRPVALSKNKIKKQSQNLSIELERTVDILATVKQQYPNLFCVGFAAETQELAQNAKSKLFNKGVNMIAANWVGAIADAAKSGFNSDMNALHLYWQGGDVELTLTNKGKLARQMITVVAEQFANYSTKAVIPDVKILKFTQDR
ncbi:Phosphopantothenoylcysteine decarboxylase / Phosphopantothenoylcysteine synthetase [hydrothermal vent metagenome]|uniref:Phosphopantothenoylcysteine decarboxylase / Phosphopantothenoylcysteine synthetase n=1 Tax=hydrothermal vent metagenome TaxID=652676 RepID=A0A3B1B8X1_9ZZZZ